MRMDARICWFIIGDGRRSLSFVGPRRARCGPTSRVPAIVRREIAPEGGRWFTNAATLADLDGDGHADLIVGNYFPDDARILDARLAAARRCSIRCREPTTAVASTYSAGRVDRGLEPTVQFEEARGVLDEPGASSWTLAIGAADLDGDLLPEIYLANDFGPDRLLHNRSRPGEFHFALLEGRKSADHAQFQVGRS